MASRAAIYAKLVGSRVRSQTQYRLSFALSLVGTFFFAFLDFIAILVIFHHLTQLAGWSLGEVAFLYGTSYMVFKTADLFLTNIDRLPLLIRMGTFDQILTRPLGSLGQVMTTDIGLRQMAAIAQGAAVFAFALVRVPIDWTAPKVLVLISMLVSGLFIFGSIFVATNAIAFWTMDAREVANSFTYGGQFLTQFPMHIFGVWLRRLLGFVVPLAFVNYFPALFVLSKDDPLNAPYVLRFASPLVALVSVLVASGIWRRAIRHYRSTGS